MLAGSPPRAMTTGIRSPFSAISRQWAAPTLWRCQCIASVSRPGTWQRYIHGLRAAGSVLEQDMLEQQRRAAAGALHAAVGDLGDLEARAHGLGNADQLADAIDFLEELAEVIEGHGNPMFVRSSMSPSS